MELFFSLDPRWALCRLTPGIANHDAVIPQISTKMATFEQIFL
jgi:hypothetical protein